MLHRKFAWEYSIGRINAECYLAPANLRCLRAASELSFGWEAGRLRLPLDSARGATEDGADPC